MNQLSPATTAFLESHGGAAGVKTPGGLSDEELVLLLRASCPNPVEYNNEGRAFLSAVSDALGFISEVFYHNYRAVVDLYRYAVFSLLPMADPEDPVWKQALETGDRLGLLDPAELCPRPHKNETDRRAAV